MTTIFNKPAILRATGETVIPIQSHLSEFSPTQIYIMPDGTRKELKMSEVDWCIASVIKYNH